MGSRQSRAHGEMLEHCGASARHVLTAPHLGRQVSPPCPYLLRSQTRPAASCLLPLCHDAALAKDIVFPRVQVTGGAEEGAYGCCPHRGGTGSAEWCSSPPQTYWGPLDMTNGTVLGLLGCCKASL